MTRYLQVSSDIAERVAAGMLAGGDELPSIRRAAQRYDTTGTTIARAWRHLADAGVIEVSDRRRAHIAAGGDVAARRLLGGHPALRLAGSDDPGLDIALRRAGASVVTVGTRGSFHGLTRIWRGTADAAAIHLRHRSGDGNHPFARSLLRGRQPAIIHLWRREQGLLIPDGNPGRISGPADLRGLRIARRPFGTGTRVLLDRLLTDAGIPPDIGHRTRRGLPPRSRHDRRVRPGRRRTRSTRGSHRARARLRPVGWEDFDIVLSGVPWQPPSR